jgi:hypothetical protein
MPDLEALRLGVEEALPEGRSEEQLAQGKLPG